MSRQVNDTVLWLATFHSPTIARVDSPVITQVTNPRVATERLQRLIEHCQATGQALKLAGRDDLLPVQRDQLRWLRSLKDECDRLESGERDTAA